MSENEYALIKRNHYNNMLELVGIQGRKIDELQKLKANLLDENQKMSTALRIKESKCIVDPQDIIDAAKKQLVGETLMPLWPVTIV